MFVKSYVPSAQRQIRRLLKRNLQDMVDVLVEQTKANISIMGPPRSTAGQFPRIDTQALHDDYGATDIVESPGMLAAKVGSTMEYAMDLEYGTDRMRPRPWIRRSVVGASNDMARAGTQT